MCLNVYVKIVNAYEQQMLCSSHYFALYVEVLCEIHDTNGYVL